MAANENVPCSSISRAARRKAPQNIRDSGGLDAPVRDGAEIYILPAVSGR